MKVQVKIKLKSKNEGVEETPEGLVVKVNEPPVDGKANKRVIELLAKHFNVAKSQVALVAGAKSKLKTFAIDD